MASHMHKVMICRLIRLLQGSPGDAEQDSFKKPRRSERLSQRPDNDVKKTPISTKHQLPSPVTHPTSGEEANERFKEATATPPEGRPSQVLHHDAFSSPPQDTQAFSQQVDPNAPLSDEVEDEVKEGVWGYLFPLNTRYGGKCVVLRKRASCPLPDTVAEAVKSEGSKKKKGKKALLKEAESFDERKVKGLPSGGYLIGRHPECDIVVDDPIVSNRHSLLFTEHKGNDTVAIIEDLSSNGTFVNEAIVGRNQRRELKEHDEIAVLDKARFVFRYPKSRHISAFHQQYTLQEKLGKGHFAEVYLCVEKSSGQRYAVKIFTKQPGDKSKNDSLQQEIAVLMGVSHPNVLCLKDTFNEPSHVYLVLELAPEGELFNYIVRRQKLSEDECRKLFTQLFQGIKYLHDRNIVHRDIKPENILVVDKELHVKLADFGLAKIIGEESFTTTLCGTPCYVAPEILANSKHRKYTKAVDIWSLGVVLYICLCGFPPFSDELTSPDFPYSLSDQIKQGNYDYPSPYWDPVGDPALDLIDSMLVVNPEKRFTVDQCLAHPWMTAGTPSVNDSTNGLVSGLAGLEVNRRGVVRQRTLLSAINDVQITNLVPTGENQPDIKIYSKNPKGPDAAAKQQELRPADQRDPKEFMEMGGKGDQELFGNDGESYYSKKEIAAAGPATTATKTKGTAAPSKGKGKKVNGAK
ncbi:putative DNA damage response protein kinase [Diplogelasinospora grovesii]|uniref:DNA damage response protein kinase n=1 Tax=Diplogelasinospora grovesii TaxID=303347 RepID=A0AAN6ND92_9PEZI|nr:putative DNA damage response protein kinase [Diplogelasinospora grovesii]